MSIPENVSVNASYNPLSCGERPGLAPAQREEPQPRCCPEQLVDKASTERLQNCFGWKRPSRSSIIIQPQTYHQCRPPAVQWGFSDIPEELVEDEVSAGKEGGRTRRAAAGWKFAHLPWCKDPTPSRAGAFPKGTPHAPLFQCQKRKLLFESGRGFLSTEREHRGSF